MNRAVGQRSRKRRTVEAFVVLLRNTTWKCGKIEKSIVSYLNEKLRGRNYRKVKVKELIKHFRLQGRKRSEFMDAMRRLERRRIIKIEMTPT